MKPLDLQAGQLLALKHGVKYLHALDVRANSLPLQYWSPILDRVAGIGELEWGFHEHEFKDTRAGSVRQPRGTPCTEACERMWGDGLYCGGFVDGDHFNGGEYLHVPGHGGDTRHRVRCLHAIGDTLRVREAWRTSLAFDEMPASKVDPDSPVRYEADKEQRPRGPVALGELRQPRSMPPWASRLTAGVRSVRVCRLHDVDGDASRGMGYRDQTSFRLDWSARNRRPHTRWNQNPWIWVLGIEVTTC